VVAFSSIILKVLLNYIFISKLSWGIGGITLSTSLVTLFNACVLGYFITRKMNMDYKNLFFNLLKMTIAGLIALLVCFAAGTVYDNFVHLGKYSFEALQILLVAVLCLGVYVPLNLIMKMEYATELFNRIKSKIVR
jgi:putative peptidoglycan lipid II flippase